MADKKPDSKTTPSSKPSSAAAKPAAKPTAAAKPASTGKATVIDGSPTKKTLPTDTKTATTKPTATVKPAPSAAPKAEAKPASAPAAKPAATPKAAAKSEDAPKSTTKSAAKQESEVAAAAAVSAPKSADKPKTTAKSSKDKKEKPAKSKRGEGKAAAVAVLNPKNIKFIIMGAVAFVLIIALIIGIVVGTKSCNSSTIPPFSSDGPPESLDTVTVPNDKPVTDDTELLSPASPAEAAKDSFKVEYANTTAVGYYAEVTGTYERVKPVEEVKNEAAAFYNDTIGNLFDGKARYPKYGSTLKHVIGGGEAQVAARGALVQEACYLAAWGTRGANRGGEQTPEKYTRIDKDGYLYQYKNNEWIHSLEHGTEEYVPENYRQLYKHSAATGMYMEGYTKNGVKYEVPDNAEGVVKEVTMRSRGYSSYGVTGLYAPAGEVIKVELSGADMNKTGGITVHIGQALYNGQANNIWVGKNAMQRFPIVLTTLELNKSTCEYNQETDTWTGYIGSFVGGPIYLRNEGVKFTTKISGGLEYLHFILGYTTEEEFTRIKSTSKVPYFDLEVWNYGVLHSGPRYYAEGFSYDNLYKAAILWEKVSSVTTTNGSKQGIVFIYDPFVAAGAAVAFPGRSSVNCPAGWMSQSLNYNTLVSSGSWGNFHEYHHNFQNYGLGSGADGETTNNALNIVSYSLFTKISSKRGIGSYGAQGLGGWNNYTSATWTLQRVKAGQITSTNGLAVYSTLMHNFGQEAFIQARGTRGANNYFNKWANVTHHDMTYYAELTDKYYNGGSNKYTPSDAVKNANYPMFVPVACVYQTGRSYMYDGEKRYSKTMQPYVIANKPFNIDLSEYSAPGGQYASGSIVIPEGFTYRVKSVTKPANGTIEITDDFNIKYTPAAGARTGSTSGQIIVTLEIVKNDGAFEVEDVDLVLEFQISQEMNKMTLERTTYTYSADGMYDDAVEAYNANFAGSTDKEERDHSNPTQNANTDIWFYPNTTENHNKYTNDKFFFHDNTIEVIDGKLYFDEDGTYRVYLRGRDNCALYYSPDGKNYSLGAKITASTPATISNKKANTALFRPGAAETYFDVKFDEGKVYVKQGADADFPENYVYEIKPNENNEIENWLYIREVLIVSEAARSFIGVGSRQWTETMFTVEETYHKADGTALISEEDDDFAYTRTSYKDYQGNEVAYSRKNVGSDTTQYFKKSGNSFVASTEKEVSELTASSMIAPTVTDSTQPYANAYRTDYNFPNNSDFEAPYFYTRSYNYNYVGVPKETSTWNDGVKIVSCNKQPWDNTTKIDNLLTEGQTTFFHSAKNSPQSKGAMVLELDMGKEISANLITFYGRSPQAATTAQQGLPKNFSLEVSKDGQNYTSAGTYTNGTGAARSATVTLNGTYEFRYVKITINSTHNNSGHFILSGIKFTHAFNLTGNGNNHISPTNDNIILTDSKNGKGTWKVEVANSSFGRIVVGNKGDVVEFDFTGTRVAILTSVDYDNNFEVYIDGNKVESIEDVAPLTDVYGITYLSQKLTSEKHHVEIRCTGETAFDSFAFYNEG